MYHGDVRVDPSLAVGPAFISLYDIDRSNIMLTATERDGPTGASNVCGNATLRTVQSAGPFSYVNDSGSDFWSPFGGDSGGNVYSVTYHDRILNTPWLDGGQCKVQTSIDSFSGVDSAGFGDDARGAGTICVTRVSGPDVVIEPLELRVGRRANLRVRIQTQGTPIPFKGAKVRLAPAAINGSLFCVDAADAKGNLACVYEAPARKATTETVTGDCAGCNSTASSTITVTGPPKVFGFFNGVWNTEEEAGMGLDALKKLVGASHDNAPIRYESFYNQTGKGGSGSPLQDIAETFVQRGVELDGVLNDRWEHYWDLLAGRHGDPDSLTGSLIKGLGSGGLALARLLDATFNATLGQIVGGWARLLSDPPTEADLNSHLAKLRILAGEDAHLVLLAHSQGNLFANAAHDGLLASHPRVAVKVVHVAPASPTTRGEYGLSDLDLVVNALRIQGGSSVRPANWSLPFSSVDASGHMLVATYLDAAREGRAKVKALVASAFDGLASP